MPKRADSKASLVGMRITPAAVFKNIETLHVFGEYLKIEYLKIGRSMTLFGRFWNRQKTSLYRPTKRQLCRTAVVAFGHFPERRIN